MGAIDADCRPRRCGCIRAERFIRNYHRGGRDATGESNGAHYIFSAQGHRTSTRRHRRHATMHITDGPDDAAVAGSARTSSNGRSDIDSNGSSSGGGDGGGTAWRVTWRYSRRNAPGAAAFVALSALRRSSS
mmetsp:Transcript_7654/g.16655  ORF Transcript_7654/g.16655 Transcript_7654/m.16655 type:complete len:132 (+) Transcript_7654:398-793(+)